MKSHLLTILAATTALSGCGLSTTRANPSLDQSFRDVETSLERMSGTGGVRSGGVQLSERPFVAAQRERNSAATRLPASVQSANSVHLQSRDPMGIADIASRLTEITRIPHTLALGPAGRVVSEPAAAEAQAGDLNEEGEVRLVGRPQPASARANAVEDLRIRPNLRGPLSSVLDEVAASFELDWTFSDGRVIFRDFVTRQYQIAALPIQATTATSMGSNGISSTTSSATDVWSEITESLENIISEGSTMSVGSSTGTITITARTGDHARVADYIRATNERVGQQVAFDVNVITVVLNDNESFGLDLSAALRSNGIELGVVGRPQTSDSVGSINIGITRSDVSVQAIARSLSSYGRVSVETRAGTTTANNRVAPIEVVDEIAYLREVRIEEGTNGGRERVTRSADTATTGFQMQLLPRIMNTRDIMVQYSVRISELNNLRTFGDGNEAIQLPEISTTSFEQQAVLENGQTLIMAGFERRRVESSRNSGLGLLSIARAEDQVVQRVATVLMITPTLVRR